MKDKSETIYEENLKAHNNEVKRLLTNDFNSIIDMILKSKGLPKELRNRLIMNCTVIVLNIFVCCACLYSQDIMFAVLNMFLAISLFGISYKMISSYLNSELLKSNLYVMNLTIAVTNKLKDLGINAIPIDPDSFDFDKIDMKLYNKTKKEYEHFTREMLKNKCNCKECKKNDKEIV